MIAAHDGEAAPAVCGNFGSVDRPDGPRDTNRGRYTLFLLGLGSWLGNWSLDSACCCFVLVPRRSPPLRAWARRGGTRTGATTLRAGRAGYSILQKYKWQLNYMKYKF